MRRRLLLFVVLLCALKESVAFWPFGNKGAQTPCGNEQSVPCKLNVFANGEWENGQSVELSSTDCTNATDGKALSALVCERVQVAPGCTIFSAVGVEVTGCADLKVGDAVYVVPENRLFMWPSHEVGHKTAVHHVETPNKRPIVLETLSQRPRVFRLENFITDDESDHLVEHALSIEDEAFKLKRSSTGATGYTVDSKRTSEGAFDVGSPTALAIKKRCFDLLGIRPYEESFADGIQILRYNQTTAYIAHMDWIEPTKLNNNHDWESAGEGTNRYATILLYLSEVEDGGETVFTQAKPIEGAPVVSKKVAEAETTTYLDNQNLTHLFPLGTWQRNMVVECRSRMAIKPRKAQAVLFYSQFPDGNVDRLSIHGGCPVLVGTKWAANLWVWNGPRNGYPKRKRGVGGEEGGAEPRSPAAVKATFKSEVDAGVHLYWQDQDWGSLKPNAPIKVNTFEGHEWSLRLNDEVFASWTVGEELEQVFLLTQDDLPKD